MLRRLAEARGVSPAQVGWPAAGAAGGQLVIIGASGSTSWTTPAAVGLALTADELAELDKVSALPPEYPGWMHVRQGEYRRQQLREAGLA